jgi:hypothetical protein
MTQPSTPTLNPHGAFADAEEYAHYTRNSPTPGALEPFVEREIEDCRAWLKAHASKRVTFNRSHGSYGLKHEVERWLRTHVRTSGPDCYISNGAFIAAAVLEGYKFRLRRGGPNAEFNCRFDLSRPPRARSQVR